MKTVFLHQRARAWVLGALTFLCLLPFFDKAFHVDDPIFLWPAKQMLAGNPRPLSAAANWYGDTSTLAEVTNHFPFVSRLMVPVVALAGWSEPALHAEFALIAAAVILGMYFLAGTICDHPVASALMLLASPAFFVSATSVMSDVPMLCFWIWSIVVWFSALRSDRPWMFLIAGILMTAAALSKYPGIAIVPLLAVAATSRRRAAWQVAALILPVIALAVAQLATRRMYGNGIVGIAVVYATGRANLLATLPTGLFNALCFIGGCFPAAPIVWCLSWNHRRAKAAALIAIGLIAMILLLGEKLIPLSPSAEPNRTLITWHAILFCLLGALSLGMAGTELALRRDRTCLLLALWVLGVFLFAGVVNWTTNAHSVLPMGPALVLLSLRALPKSHLRTFDLRIVLPIGLSAILSFILALADMKIADASREAASLIHTRARTFHGTLWFTGHWGFQWYMERNGAVPMDYSQSLLRAGDLLTEPRQASNILPMPEGTTQPVDQIDMPVLGWVSTINIPTGAVFYTSAAGPLPYVFGPMAPQHFTVYRIVQNILPPGSGAK